MLKNCAILNSLAHICVHQVCMLLTSNGDHQREHVAESTETKIFNTQNLGHVLGNYKTAHGTQFPMQFGKLILFCFTFHESVKLKKNWNSPNCKAAVCSYAYITKSSVGDSLQYFVHFLFRLRLLHEFACHGTFSVYCASFCNAHEMCVFRMNCKNIPYYICAVYAEHAPAHYA